jgi:hypothetical protein
MELIKKYIKSQPTAHNRTVYASGAVAPSGYEKPQSACGLCAVFLRNILARRNATHCFMGGPKRSYTAGTLCAMRPKLVGKFCE